MKRIYIFLVLICVAFCGVAQPRNVFFEGQFEGASGKRVMLIRYSDPLSQREIVADSVTIDSNNHFTLSTFVDYPTLVVIEVEDYSQSFYVEAGRTYRMRLEGFDWCADERVNVHIHPVTLPIVFDGLPEDELNLAIGRFEMLCDSFLVANGTHLDLRYRPERRYFDTLKGIVNHTEFGHKSDFFDRYKTYRMAEMEYNLGLSSREGIFNRLVKNEPIRYYDESYMSLVLTLFSNAVSQGTKRIRKYQLTNWVASSDVAGYADALGAEPLLKNERLRELVMLEALWESYFDREDYNYEKVYAMVDRIGQSSKFEEHRRLAQDLCESMMRVEGKEVNLEEGFVFCDERRGAVSLDSLRGKWLYVAFIRVDDANSVGEMETMAHFRDTVYAMWGDSVAFVTIVCDREFQKMYHFLNNRQHSRRYEWQWLHFDGNYDFLNKVGVVAYPTFVLFDPSGKCVDNYAPWPGSGYLTRGPWVKKEVQEKEHLFKF